MSFIDDVLARVGAPPNSRQFLLPIAIGLLVCVGLIAGYIIYLNHPYEIAFSGLRSADASSVVDALEKKKIPYQLKDGGSTILVPDNLVDAAKLDMVDEDPATKDAVGFELFNKSDMGTTEFAQRINYQRALQGELARTIMSLDSVETARVHLSLPEATIFRDDRRPPKASVTIVPRPGHELTNATIDGVKRLVAAAVPDLDPKDVVILDEHGVAAGGANADASVDPAPAAIELQGIEQYYLGLVKQGLTEQFPSTSFDVAVSAPTATADHSGIGDWSPRSRRFPLSVKVYAEGLSSPEDQQLMRGTVNTALSSSPDVVDQVTFVDAPIGATTDVAAPAVQPTPSTLSASHAALPPADGGEPRTFWWIAAAALLAPFGLLAILLGRFRAAGGASLTARGRRDYVSRLKRLISEVDSDAASQI